MKKIMLIVVILLVSFTSTITADDAVALISVAYSPNQRESEPFLVDIIVETPKLEYKVINNLRVFLTYNIPRVNMAGTVRNINNFGENARFQVNSDKNRLVSYQQFNPDTVFSINILIIDGQTIVFNQDIQNIKISELPREPINFTLEAHKEAMREAKWICDSGSMSYINNNIVYFKIFGDHGKGSKYTVTIDPLRNGRRIPNVPHETKFEGVEDENNYIIFAIPSALSDWLETNTSLIALTIQSNTKTFKATLKRIN